MTEIKIFYKNNVPLKLEVNGHSGYAAKGNDIVCASISSICYYLGILSKKNIYKDKLYFNSDKKLNKITIEVKKYDENLKEIILSAIEFFKELERQYKNNIKIKEVNKDGT